MQRLAIFASGRGSNAASIIEVFNTLPQLDVSLIISNKSSAGVLDLARENNIQTHLIKKADSTQSLISILHEHKINWIALAGYLKKIPKALILAFPQRILNIHPALLPSYGGPGMYGHHVHEAVSASGDPQSGMTIHYVNEDYDKGKIIYQAACDITPFAPAAEIAASVLKLEHQYYPKILASLISGDLNL